MPAESEASLLPVPDSAAEWRGSIAAGLITERTVTTEPPTDSPTRPQQVRRALAARGIDPLRDYCPTPEQYREMAEELGLAESTVRQYVSNLRGELRRERGSNAEEGKHGRPPMITRAMVDSFVGRAPEVPAEAPEAEPAPPLEGENGNGKRPWTAPRLTELRPVTEAEAAPPPAECPALFALLRDLPDSGRWTGAQRNRWLRAVIAVVEVEVEVIDRGVAAGGPDGLERILSLELAAAVIDGNCDMETVFRSNVCKEAP